LKIVFADTEFTGEHSKTTLVSVGFVTLDNKKLYITLNDFNKGQVTPWLKKNVLSKIDKKLNINKKEAYQKISKFLSDYSKGEKIQLITAGKGLDLILIFDLFHQKNLKKKYMHYLYDLPKYLNHEFHLDIYTLFYLCGYNKKINREKFAELKGERKKHNALYDAMVIRKCFLKLIKNFLHLHKKIKNEI
jgi:DNA polymerase III epsilon subunit-like protein